MHESGQADALWWVSAGQRAACPVDEQEHLISVQALELRCGTYIYETLYSTDCALS